MSSSSSLQIDDDLAKNLSPEELAHMHALLLEDAAEQATSTPLPSGPIDFTNTSSNGGGGGGQQQQQHRQPKEFVFDQSPPSSSNTARSVLSPRSIRFAEHTTTSPSPSSRVMATIPILTLPEHKPDDDDDGDDGYVDDDDDSDHGGYGDEEQKTPQPQPPPPPRRDNRTTTSPPRPSKPSSSSSSSPPRQQTSPPRPPVDASGGDGGGTLYDQVQMRLQRSMSLSGMAPPSPRPHGDGGGGGADASVRNTASKWRNKAKSKRGSQTPRASSRHKDRRPSRAAGTGAKAKAGATTERLVRSRHKSATANSSFKNLFAQFKEQKDAAKAAAAAAAAANGGGGGGGGGGGDSDGLKGKHEETFSPSGPNNDDDDDDADGMLLRKTAVGVSAEEVESMRRQLDELKSKVKETASRLDGERQKRRSVEKERLILKSDLNEARRQLTRGDDVASKATSELKRVQSDLDAARYELQVARNMVENDPQNRRLMMELKQRDLVIGELCQRINAMESDSKNKQSEKLESSLSSFTALVRDSNPLLLERRLLSLEHHIQLQQLQLQQANSGGWCGGRPSKQIPPPSSSAASSTITTVAPAVDLAPSLSPSPPPSQSPPPALQPQVAVTAAAAVAEPTLPEITTDAPDAALLLPTPPPSKSWWSCTSR